MQESSATGLFLGVPSLPKGALVEKQVLMHTGQCLVTEDDDVAVRSLAPKLVEGKTETLFYRKREGLKYIMQVAPNDPKAKYTGKSLLSTV